ncbi:DUF1365 domain-containing protein [Alteromonas oceanisediminis]|uniref:DUF1365 domain-containing protein n=1 Tax=Alteromonas oceanisediminis TaxID=2836180 RepID=UPI001BDADEA3|nr:DUF1365 domain-containing protein [Alteromonas oceanisediminis]MBT0585829.1 DUF1365 family protein [Alteromonas oceanisediminis]
MSPTSSDDALYVGDIFHQRVVPKHHEFTYRIFLFWLNLDNLENVAREVRGFSIDKFAPARFKRSDYLGDPSIRLKSAVLQRVNELVPDSSVNPVKGDVFLLGQVRTFGLYFSPVNFYFIRNEKQQYTHMLAEVSNTPWNKRHHYLVDLDRQEPCDKAFHVSPFNPIDMVYHWSVKQPDEHLRLSLSCFKEQRHFTAALKMTRMSLNSKTLVRVMLSIPSMTIKTVFGIYWQALKLFIKRVPFYSYPKNKEL